jgi:DNA invertase Pin-like site-specific DNA recombinase
MRFFGYARVSTSQQSLEIQKQVLKNAGVKESRIFFDKSTGGNIDRPGLNSLLVKVEEGCLTVIANLPKHVYTYPLWISYTV